MRTRLGGILAIVLGSVLIAAGTTNGGLTVGSASVGCGGFPIGVSPLCPTGHIVITKTVTGPGTRPSAGWTFTISSTDCDLFPGTSSTVHIAAAGGTVSSGTLFATRDSRPATLCHYTVAETAVAGWTTTYSPTGELTLGTATDTSATANDVALHVTNTSPTPTTSAPATHSSSASVSATASASPTAPLATTGSNHTPTTLAGIALVLLGGVMLFLGRKPRRATH